MSDGNAYDSRPDTLAHIRRVRDHIDVFVAEMLARGRAHDASKLEEPEKAVYLSAASKASSLVLTVSPHNRSFG
jgi:hypothetical protein